MTRKNQPWRREIRRVAAVARAEGSLAKVGPASRLAALDRLFGDGKGATKERLRLHGLVK